MIMLVLKICNLRNINAIIDFLLRFGSVSHPPSPPKENEGNNCILVIPAFLLFGSLLLPDYHKTK